MLQGLITGGFLNYLALRLRRKIKSFCCDPISAYFASGRDGFAQPATEYVYGRNRPNLWVEPKGLPYFSISYKGQKSAFAESIVQPLYDLDLARPPVFRFDIACVQQLWFICCTVAPGARKARLYKSDVD